MEATVAGRMSSYQIIERRDERVVKVYATRWHEDSRTKLGPHESVWIHLWPFPALMHKPKEPGPMDIHRFPNSTDMWCITSHLAYLDTQHQSTIYLGQLMFPDVEVEDALLYQFWANLDTTPICAPLLTDHVSLHPSPEEYNDGANLLMDRIRHLDRLLNRLTGQEVVIRFVERTTLGGLLTAWNEYYLARNWPKVYCERDLYIPPVSPPEPPSSTPSPRPPSHKKTKH
ncbi:hypothetical protein F5880DRAFT_482403 [Lentinula raphanica]|nr:hypothetical protein F5880DRAFT_482403 [Lentinula raphanica]